MYYELAATPATCHWGYFDNSLEPVLQIASGDIVKIECICHQAGLAPDLMFDEGVREVWDAITAPQRGPGAHIVTGPIAILGAEPRDTLEVRFLQARPRLRFGVNVAGSWGPMYAPTPLSTIRTRLRTLESTQHVVVYEADWANGIARGYAQFSCPREPRIAIGTVLDATGAVRRPFPDVAVTLRPHMGIAGVAPAGRGRVSTNPPGVFGGNIDNRSYLPGTRMFYPVQVANALFWAGDTHLAEGDGEICGTAIESHLDVMLQFVLHKELRVTTPVLETDTQIMVHGFHENLYESVRSSAVEAVREMRRRWGLTPREAYSLLSVACDCRITQVVNGVKGTHFIIPKSLVNGPPTGARTAKPHWAR
ncbi:MAG: hypothetical protein EPN41_11515 [Candidimonas sp.]|nr:MAG: hypothetical protein EPN41_11515 [Candidimonas sp.]